MYNFNDIEKYLREGGDVETIAKAFTDELNRAIAVVEDENDLEICKESLIEAWNDYINTYFKHKKLPKGYTVKDFHLNSKEIDEITKILAEMVPVVDRVCELGNKSTDTVKDFFTKFGI